MNDTKDIIKMIEAQLNALPDFGQLQLSLKKHVGTWSNADMVKVTNVKYKDAVTDPASPAYDPEYRNINATTDIVKLFKGSCEYARQLKSPITLSFNLVIDKNGKAELLQVQDFKKL